jgi:hypothetical protein
LSDSPLRSFLFYRTAEIGSFSSSATIPETVLTVWHRLWEQLASVRRLLRKKKKENLSEMVRTRATTSEANNPRHETGGVSHQNAAKMEARMAQMSRDMEVLAQQNLRLLRRLADE